MGFQLIVGTLAAKERKKSASDQIGRCFMATDQGVDRNFAITSSSESRWPFTSASISEQISPPVGCLR